MCAFQRDANVDTCPTPDAPRGQTKAPRLDIYRPAPHVVVDTGRPGKNKAVQGQQELPDNSRSHDGRPQGSQSQSKSSQPESRPPDDRLSREDSKTSQNHVPVVLHAQSKPPRPNESLPVAVRSSPPKSKEQIQSVPKTQPNMSEPKSKLQDVQVQTKPSRTPNAISRREMRLEGSRQPEFAETQTKRPPLPLRDTGKLRDQSETSVTALDGNGDTEVGEKSAVERSRHHRHHCDRDEVVKSGGQETTDNGTASDPDYAMKYRLGLVPRRSKEPKRKSEYQRQFQWRAFEQNSPLMSAAEVTSSLRYKRIH